MQDVFAHRQGGETKSRFETVLEQLAGGLLRLTLNRPEKLDALRGRVPRHARPTTIR
jgi:hypothetical protein